MVSIPPTPVRPLVGVIRPVRFSRFQLGKRKVKRYYSWLGCNAALQYSDFVDHIAPWSWQSRVARVSCDGFHMTQRPNEWRWYGHIRPPPDSPHRHHRRELEMGPQIMASHQRWIHLEWDPGTGGSTSNRIPFTDEPTSDRTPLHMDPPLIVSY